ncbi:MAG: DUF2752 domain-containing protein [Bacteroidales bacterium]
MTLLRSKNNYDQQTLIKFRNEPYLLINIILAGVILLIFAYSGFFSPDTDNYPVACIHEKLTGEPCASCGLSHSFSLILRGRISEALGWNVYGLRVFLFFASQLVMRISFSLFYLKNPDTRQQLILYDITASIVVFLISFLPFIEFIIRSVYQ